MTSSGAGRPRAGRWVLLLTAACACGLGRVDYSRGLSRSAWQRPDLVVEALGLEPGDRVADIGAGRGFFSFPLADAVGPSGRVYAVEISAEKVADLEKRVARHEYENVEVVLGRVDDPTLPDGSIDVVFLCDTYHHIDERPDYFRRLRADLAPGGRVAIVEGEKWNPLLVASLSFGHWTSREELEVEMREAGYRRVARYDILPSQLFEVYAPDGAAP